MRETLLNRLRLVLIGLFLLVGVSMLTLFNLTKPRIMIVHSLSKESSWSGAVDQGMSQVLARNRMPVSVTRDFLNLDILSAEADLQALTRSLRLKIEAFDPHVLIAVDDETNDILARHYVGRPRPRLIYTGLMHRPERYGYGPGSGVWGIRELIPLHGVSTLLEQARPGRALRVAAVGIADLTGSAELEQVLAHDWLPHRLVAHALVPDFQSWKAFVGQVGQEADVLLVLSVDKVPSGEPGLRMVSEADVVVWTEAHARPVPIGVRTSHVHMGGGLAVSVPPTELGARAMELALARVRDPAFIPEAISQVPRSFDISARLSALRSRGIELPMLYGEAARAAGHLYP
jgi:hypothetical protein